MAVPRLEEKNKNNPLAAIKDAMRKVLITVFFRNVFSIKLLWLTLLITISLLFLFDAIKLF